MSKKQIVIILPSFPPPAPSKLLGMLVREIHNTAEALHSLDNNPSTSGEEDDPNPASTGHEEPTWGGVSLTDEKDSRK